ncbi:MAG: PEP-CTERM sorting domain-containing protein [Phycisphaerales bacterium]|jgi:hypothetical protein
MKIALMVAAALAAASSAQAVTTFSFASDTDPSQFTFSGNGAQVSNGTPAPTVTLLVGNGNGGQAPLSFNVEFRSNFSISYVVSTPVSGGFQHIYNVQGNQGQSPTFGFYVPGTNDALLTATFEGGIFRSAGTQNAWGSGANVEASDITGQVTYTWFGASNAAYGLVAGGSSFGLDDAAFTLSNLQSGQPATNGVGLNADNYPIQSWNSEGSFSGTANFVPSPGAIALMGLGGLAMARRRR